MKTIIRRIPARISRSYKCETCGTTYASKKRAQECEKRILEKRKFKEGDLVNNIKPRFCCDKPYFFGGEVVKILGPMPSDEDYENRHLGGRSERVNGHVFMYEVSYICPHCLNLKSVRYYGPELKKRKNLI